MDGSREQAGTSGMLSEINSLSLSAPSRISLASLSSSLLFGSVTKPQKSEMNTVLDYLPAQ